MCKHQLNTGSHQGCLVFLLVTIWVSKQPQLAVKPSASERQSPARRALGVAIERSPEPATEKREKIMVSQVEAMSF